MFSGGGFCTRNQIGKDESDPRQEGFRGLCATICSSLRPVLVGADLPRIQFGIIIHSNDSVNEFLPSQDFGRGIIPGDWPDDHAHPF